jgi:hypothetical protein
MPAIENASANDSVGVGVVIGLRSAAVQPIVVWSNILRYIAAQEIPARHEEIGQRASHQQVMDVLGEPAIAHPGKAEHSFDDPIRRNLANVR